MCQLLDCFHALSPLAFIQPLPSVQSHFTEKKTGVHNPLGLHMESDRNQLQVYPTVQPIPCFIRILLFIIILGCVLLLKD